MSSPSFPEITLPTKRPVGRPRKEVCARGHSLLNESNLYFVTRIINNKTYNVRQCRACHRLHSKNTYNKHIMKNKLHSD